MLSNIREGRALTVAVGTLAGLLGLAVLAGLFGTSFFAARTIHELLTRNRRLKQSLTNLTAEEQIGYAKVLRQERREGKLFTTLKFVETARGDKRRHVLSKQATIQGDVVYFDALIVKFSDQMVMDGRERALYLWRRIYGQNTAPSRGTPIEEPGTVPERYRGLLGDLHESEREMFWQAVWELAHDTDRLEEYGIRAVYGNAVYSQLRPGVIYVFKISPSGQVYPETVPDI